MIDIFDYLSNRTNIKVNAVSGTIVKNYKKSFFVKFNLDSHLAGHLLDIEPYMYRGNNRTPVTVIQCMCAGGRDGSEMIAEVMWKEDFEEIFET